MLFQFIPTAVLAALTIYYLATRFLVNQNATRSIPIPIRVRSRHRLVRTRDQNPWS